MSDASESELIAKAVACDLTAKADMYSLPFVAEYKPLPKYKLSDFTTIRVDVADTAQRQIGRGARGHLDYEYDVTITARERVEDDESVTLSRLKKLAEQFADAFGFDSPTGREETLDRTDMRIEPDMVEEQLLGKVVLVLTFFGHRNKPE